ncbi:MAG: iron-sulfur cluster assembly protein [Halobacteria archaeon]|nr:iron-sulfur cluster assembly protein [Halobacteria archaeon]
MTDETENESEDTEEKEFDSLEDEIMEELTSVHDPEIPVNIVDLGLIYEMEIDDGDVDIEMTLTSMGCPTADSIMREVELTAEQVDGVENAEVELVWQPPWTPEKVSDEGKTRLQAMGINI